MNIMRRRAIARSGVTLTLIALLITVFAVGWGKNEVMAQEDGRLLPGPRELSAAQVERARQQWMAMQAYPLPAKADPVMGQTDVGQDASPPANLDESEWNGNFNAADPMSVGDVISAKIGAKTDQDFFVVDTSNYAYEMLLFDVDAGDGSPLDAVICLYDADQDPVVCKDDSDGVDPLIYQDATWLVGGDPPIDWQMIERVYVQITDYNYPNAGGAAYTYKLSVSQPILISANVNGTASGVSFTKSDILAWQRFNNGAEKWSMLLDASDLGITADLEAIGMGHGLSFVVGANQSLIVDETTQTVKPQDIIMVDFPVGLFNFGSQTSGALWFDYRGQDYGLTTVAEKIDALGDSWYPSTVGVAVHANGQKFQDEDVFNLPYGYMTFDGSTVPGLAVEDVIGYQQWVEPNNVALIIEGSGKVAGHAVNQKQVFSIDRDTKAWGGVLWNGPDHGFNYPLDAIGW